MQYYADLSQLKSSSVNPNVNTTQNPPAIPNNKKDVYSSPRRSGVQQQVPLQKKNEDNQPAIQSDLLMALSGLIILVEGAMFTINIFSYFFWANEASFALMIVSGLTIVLGLAVMFWTISVRENLRIDGGKNLKPREKITGAWLLFGCIIIIGLFYTFILSSWMWNNYAISYGEAKEYHISGAHSLSTFNNLVILQTVLFFFLFFFLGSVTSILFKISLDDNFMGVVNCGISIFLAFFSVLTLFLSIACLRLADIEFLEEKLSKNLIIGCLICSCVGGISAVLYFLNTFFNRTKFLIAIGYGLFFFVVVSACFSGLTFRNAKNVRDSLANNCPELLRDTFKDALEGIGCPNKYLNDTHTFPNKQCPLEQQTYFWEIDEGKNFSSKSYQKACLNLNCCKLTANYNLRWYYRLITCMIGLVFFGMLLAGGSLQFSQEASINGKDTYKIYTVTGFLLLSLLLFVAIIYIFLNPLTILRESALTISSEDLRYTTNKTALKYFSEDLKNHEIDCSPLSAFLLEDLPINFDQAHCTKNNCSNYMMRAGIFTPSSAGRLMMERDTNNKSVKIFPAQEAQTMFSDHKNKGFSFLLEGKPEYIKGLINKEMKFCPASNQQPASSKTLNIRLYQYPVENIKAVTKVSSSKIQDIEKYLKNEDIIRLHRRGEGKRSSKMLGSPTDTAVYNKYEDNFNKFVQGSWGTVEVRLQDPETGENLEGASFYLFKGVRHCHKEERGDFITVGETNKDGKFIGFNVHHGNYTIQIQKKGFFANCLSFSLSNSYETINMHLVRKIEAPNTVKVLAEWQVYDNLLELNSLFNYNDKIECLTNKFYKSCGNMKLVSESSLQNKRRTAFSSLITVDDLAQYRYLFFVNILDHNLKGSEAGKNNLEGQKLLLERGGMAIKLFVKENDYPVLLSHPDISKFFALYQNKEDLRKKTEQFFWLSFCIDGKIGPASAKPLNQYWTEKATPNDFWFRENRRGIPEGRICDRVYHK